MFGSPLIAPNRAAAALFGPAGRRRRPPGATDPANFLSAFGASAAEMNPLAEEFFQAVTTITAAYRRLFYL